MDKFSTFHVEVVAVPVAAAPVRVPVTAAAEGRDAEEVDDQPGHGDGEQLLRAHGGRVCQAFQRSGEEIQGYHRKEQAVDEA